jgi:hypothetical protein
MLVIKKYLPVFRRITSMHCYRGDQYIRLQFFSTSDFLSPLVIRKLRPSFLQKHQISIGVPDDQLPLIENSYREKFSLSVSPLFSFMESITKRIRKQR